jgi:hypothetical protein
MEQAWELLLPQMMLDAQKCNERLMQNLGGVICVSRQNVRRSQIDEYRQRRIETLRRWHERGLTLAEIRAKTGDSLENIKQLLTEGGIKWR